MTFRVLAIVSQNRALPRKRRNVLLLTLQQIPLKGRNTRGPWITTRRACQSSLRFLRGRRFSLVRFISPPSGRHPRRQTTTCVTVTVPANADTRFGRSASEHCVRHAERRRTRCVRSPPVPHSSPCIHGEERRPTT